VQQGTLRDCFHGQSSPLLIFQNEHRDCPPRGEILRLVAAFALARVIELKRVMRASSQWVAGKRLALATTFAIRSGLQGHGGIKPDRPRAAAFERFVIGQPVPGRIGGGMGPIMQSS
jgi:hypothetical protein